MVKRGASWGSIGIGSTAIYKELVEGQNVGCAIFGVDTSSDPVSYSNNLWKSCV